MRNLLLIAIFLIFVTTGFAQNLSDFIRVDQFGYRTSDSKIAVIRNPTVGNDANLSFTPGSQYALINATNNQRIYTGNIQSINNGAVDALSGDITWWFDFSTISQQGEYYVLDIQNNVKSHTFKIADNVYQNVLKQAFRTFCYQRSGIEKVAPYAETGWEDGASHLGPQQDTECRYYLTPNDPSTQKDVSGGWYDAGDYNKYTTWTSSYISQMLIAYEENPSIWTDDFNIPESNNGIPDIIDEARWGLDHFLKLQMAQTVSQVVTIDNEKDNLITFSSPSQKDFTFTLHGLENEVAIVSFYDISGKRISSESYVFNTIHEMIFNTGIYIMHVNHGDFSKSYKVVIY